MECRAFQHEFQYIQKGIPAFRQCLSNTRIWVLEALNIIFWKHMTVCVRGGVREQSVWLPRSGEHFKSQTIPFLDRFQTGKTLFVCVCVCVCVQARENGCCNCYKLLRAQTLLKVSFVYSWLNSFLSPSLHTCPTQKSRLKKNCSKDLAATFSCV